ncbi:MAG: type IV pilin [Thermoplasmata archaeon]|nr:type IV pilin [Thermoplasmata archaeon]
MRMRSGIERRWRTNGKRGVSPIIATILLVAITVVLAAVLYVLISGLTRGPGNTPLGSAIAFNSAQVGACSAGSCTYTITIATVSSAVTLNSIKTQLVGSGGNATTFGTMTAKDASGCQIAQLTTNGAAWTLLAAPTGSGGACGQGGYPVITLGTGLTSGDQFVLVTGAAINQKGYQLNFIGTASYAGTVGVALP